MLANIKGLPMHCPLCNGQNKIHIGSKANIEVSQCVDCGFYYTDPMPEDEVITDFYQDYHSTNFYNNKALKKTFTAMVKIYKAQRHCKLKNKTFLDVGCNIGAIVNAAQKLGFSAMGIDLDQATIERAKKKFLRNEYYAMSIQDLAASGRKYDLVFCTEVIEHTPYIHEFAQALRDVTNPGGILYLTTPDADHYRVPKDFVSWKAVRPIEHLVWFSQKTIANLIEQHGFEIIKFTNSSRTTICLIAQAK